MKLKKQPKKSGLDINNMQSDARGRKTADEGDTAETYSPEEDRAGWLHDEMLQKNSQLCEQGAVEETASL